MVLGSDPKPIILSLEKKFNSGVVLKIFISYIKKNLTVPVLKYYSKSDCLVVCKILWYRQTLKHPNLFNKRK